MFPIPFSPYSILLFCGTFDVSYQLSFHVLLPSPRPPWKMNTLQKSRTAIFLKT